METKTCKTCGEEKFLTLELFQQGKNKKNGIEALYWYKSCKVCTNKKALIKNAKYKQKNREKLAEAQKIYYQNNKENCSLTKKNCYQKRKSYYIGKSKMRYDNIKTDPAFLEKKSLYHRKYRIKNKETLRYKNNIKRNIKRKIDPVYRLRVNFSKNIGRALKNQGTSKQGKSCLDHLGYTIQELKAHIEKQFEPWMTWDNQGHYYQDKWNDNDQSTWTWQLDHIIPHSTFKYSSMNDLAFKECWKISNLRPLSAKQNYLDGVKRTRH